MAGKKVNAFITLFTTFSGFSVEKWVNSPKIEHCSDFETGGVRQIGMRFANPNSTIR
jgi:hypothetical protein